MTLLAGALVALLPLSAQAHRGWMVPNVAEVEGKEPWVTIKAAISEDLFVADHVAMSLEKLSVIGPDGKVSSPEKLLLGRQFGSADLKLTQAGTYKVALVNESAMASYKLKGESKRWRGSPEALSKEIPAAAEDLQVTTTFGRMETYVTANSANDVALKPSGKGLELLPLDHPTGLLVGQKTRFRVLLDGQPLSGLTLAVVPGGVRYRGLVKEFTVTSDANGEVAVVWPMAEMYWLNASYPPRAPAAAEGQARPAAPKQRFTYSGTFEVLPE
jgi:uncharacterized GH25 family protein